MSESSKSSLLKKHILFVFVGLIATLGFFAFWSFESLEESTQEILKERLVLSKMLAIHIDEHLQEAISRLQAIASDPTIFAARASLASQKASLHDILINSPDSTLAFVLLNASGRIVLAEPEAFNQLGADLSNYTFVNNALIKGKPGVSGVMRLEGIAKPIVIIAVPVKQNGSIVGALLEALDPSKPSTAGFISLTTLGKTGYAQVVDDNGLLIGSTRPDAFSGEIDHGARFVTLIKTGQSVVSTCHRCHETEKGLQRSSRDIIAFAPLKVAPWGVAIRQSENEAFALVHDLEQKVVLIGLISLLVLAYLAFTITRGIVAPIRTLTRAAERIASGDFRVVIPAVGTDEIRVLAHSLEAMRHGLNASREEMEIRNVELQARTEEVQRKEEQRRQLLDKVIQAQEDERKRIARELHDEIGQALTALIIAVGTAEEEVPDELRELKQRLGGVRDLTSTTLEDIRRLMLDLRPTLLDDLGLVSAIGWYAEQTLSRKGVELKLETEGIKHRLPSSVETALFRVTQEAITNVVKYAAASHVTIRLELDDSIVTAIVEDNGRGFDPSKPHSNGSRLSGLGLLGMEERISLLGGTFHIESSPGRGTRLRFEIPLKEGRYADERDPCVSG